MRIDVDGVHVTLAGSDILEAVDATVDPGTLVGIVGPNGAGKTTLLRTIAGALDPDDGAVFVGDEDVHAMGSRAASRRLASVPQETSLDFEFTVREVVEMGRHPHRGRFGGGVDSDAESEIVDQALERAQVADVADRVVTTLSGGERQRVLLARALAQDAPVLVLDEPTASLDVHHQVRTLGLVRDIVEDGRTGIAAIHDLDLAARYCDILVLVADGRVQASGTPEDVLTPARLRTAFGADAVVTRDPVTRTPTVTVREDTSVPPLDAHVHVVGGTGHVSPFLPPLADATSRLTVGPVVAGSQDESVGMSAASSVTSVPPHGDLTQADREGLSEQVADADVVVTPAELADIAALDRYRDAAARLVELGPETTTEQLLAAIRETLERQARSVEMPAD